MTAFAKSSRHSPVCDKAEALRLQQRALSKASADARVKAMVSQLFSGCSREFEGDLLNALAAATAERASTYRDGAYASVLLSVHAGRVSPAIQPPSLVGDLVMSRVRAELQRLREGQAG